MKVHLRHISPGEVLSHKPYSWNALRLKALPMNLFSSVRWVDLAPVAGAAAGSRPTYLKWSSDFLSPMAVGELCSTNWNPTELVSCWPTLWGNVAGRNRSTPYSCAPPGTRPALHQRTSQLLPWPSRKGMERSGEVTTEKEKWINNPHSVQFALLWW